MTDAPLRAAVIGAGIAGIATAHALRGIGIEVDLFEQADEARSTGYQLNVMANGIFALSKIELLEPVLESGHGAAIRSLVVFDGLTGRVVRHLRTVYGRNGEFAGKSFYRGDLHRILLASMRGSGPRFGMAVEGIAEDDASGKVLVQFSEGSVQEFDLVVGADGARSGTRAQLFPEHAHLIPHSAALLFAARIDLAGKSPAERMFAAQVRQGELAAFNAPGTAVLLSHAGGGHFGVIIALPDPDIGRDIASPEQAKELARKTIADLRDPRVHYAVDLGYWEEGNPLIWHLGDINPLPAFSRGSVALCGDAAHPMIPVVGQGANQSFEDAWRLAVHLQAAAVSRDAKRIPGALDRYSRERAPHVARVQREARRRMVPMRFRSRFAHRLNVRLLEWLPQRILDRFGAHLLTYAIADPGCSIDRV